ncbi:hypothetical protein C8J56DRAFT_889601 [Mycena floridula]|nr:hypothetical protein C8J56DRAFT_889601 [Mycena floridula]
MLKIEEAQLIATFMLILFHGIYLVSFFPTMQILLWNGEATFGTRYLDYILRILIGSGSRNVSEYHCAKNAFSPDCRGLGESCQGAPTRLDFLTNFSLTPQCLQSSCAFAAIFAGDGIFIYRCWVVYYRRYLIIVLPTLLWAADTACAGVIIWVQRSSTASESLVNASGDLKSFYVAYSGLTIPLNIITTCFGWSTELNNNLGQISSEKLPPTGDTAPVLHTVRQRNLQAHAVDIERQLADSEAALQDINRTYPTDHWSSPGY